MRKFARFPGALLIGSFTGITVPLSVFKIVAGLRAWVATAGRVACDKRVIFEPELVPFEPRAEPSSLPASKNRS